MRKLYLLILSLFLLAACSNKGATIKTEDLSKISYGMSIAQVEEHLGKSQEKDYDSKEVKRQLDMYRGMKTELPIAVTQELDSKLIEGQLKFDQSGTLSLLTYHFENKDTIYFIFSDKKLVSYIYQKE